MPGLRKLLAVLRSKNITPVVLPQNATPTGAVETLDDARKVAALFPPHEVEGFTQIFYDRIQQWRDDAAAGVKP